MPHPSPTASDAKTAGHDSAGHDPAADLPPLNRKLRRGGYGLWVLVLGLLVIILARRITAHDPVLALQVAAGHAQPRINLVDVQQNFAFDLRDTGTTAAMPAWLGHNQLVFRSDRDSSGDLYLLNLETGQQQRLTDEPGLERDPRPAPDGRRLAYSAYMGRGKVQVLDVATGTRQDAAPDYAETWNAAWSPDGTQLIMLGEPADAADSSTGTQLLLSDLTTGALRPLADQAAPDQQPVWAPDGTQVAFVSMAEDNVEIAVVDVASGEVHNLSQSPWPDTSPAWAPDGNALAYIGYTATDGEIMILDLVDDSARNVTNNPAQDHQPTWSPDGQRLAFTSDRGGDFDIYVLDVAQGTAALLNDDEGWSMMPTWSPDGQLIAYLSSTTHGTELIVAAPDTGAQVYTSPIDSDSSFAWWP